jgi:apolipoprotein N-acyltransferase
MSSTVQGTRSVTPSSTCWNRIITSKWSDVALITGFVALLIIGIAASAGAFHSIGTTNAAYLAYGMYAAAGTFFIVEGVLIILRGNAKTQEPQLEVPLTSENIDALKYMGNEFVQESSYPHKKELTEYITEVLDEDGFKSNPLTFLSTWKPERTMNFLEDQASSFFHGLVYEIYGVVF